MGNNIQLALPIVLVERAPFARGGVLTTACKRSMRQTLIGISHLFFLSLAMLVHHSAGNDKLKTIIMGGAHE